MRVRVIDCIAVGGLAGGVVTHSGRVRTMRAVGDQSTLIPEERNKLAWVDYLIQAQLERHRCDSWEEQQASLEGALYLGRCSVNTRTMD